MAKINGIKCKDCNLYKISKAKEQSDDSRTSKRRNTEF